MTLFRYLRQWFGYNSTQNTNNYKWRHVRSVFHVYTVYSNSNTSLLNYKHMTIKFVNGSVSDMYRQHLPKMSLPHLKQLQQAKRAKNTETDQVLRCKNNKTTEKTKMRLNVLHARYSIHSLIRYIQRNLVYGIGVWFCAAAAAAMQ